MAAALPHEVDGAGAAAAAAGGGAAAAAGAGCASPALGCGPLPELACAALQSRPAAGHAAGDGAWLAPPADPDAPTACPLCGMPFPPAMPTADRFLHASRCCT